MDDFVIFFFLILFFRQLQSNYKRNLPEAINL